MIRTRAGGDYSIQAAAESDTFNISQRRESFKSIVLSTATEVTEL